MGKGDKRRKGADDKKFAEGIAKIDPNGKKGYTERKGKQGKRGRVTYGPF